MCIFICLLDSTKMSLPNQVRQHSSPFSGFPSLSAKLTVPQMSTLKASESSLNPHIYTHVTSSYFYSYQSCPLCVCFSSLLTSTKSLNSMCYLQQTGTPMMCQGPYRHCASKTAMKQTRKNRLPSHKVLQVEPWERHVNTSLPCDVI